MEPRLRKILQDSGVPGAAIAIVHAGQKFVLCHGVRRIDGEAVTPQTAFDLGSCSKSFVATAVALLVQEGRLSFDDRVQRWLPEARLDDAASTAELTVRDLLCNRIGLKRQIPVESFANPSLSAADIVARVRHLDRLHPFRKGYVYFNPGFMAARLLVERASGLEYGEFLQQRLFAPLGMTNSATGSQRVAQLNEVARGHARWRGEMREVAEGPFDNWQGAAGVHTSADDAIRWLEFNLRGGRSGERQVLRPELMAELQHPHNEIPRAERKLIHAPPEAARVDYCMGWWTTTLHGRRLVQHAGEMIGWRAHVALLPEDAIGVCVMLNASTPRHQVLAYTVLEMLLAGTSRDWVRVADGIAIAMNAATLRALELGFPIGNGFLPIDAYAGRYGHPACGGVEVVRVGEGLEMHFVDGRVWDLALRFLGGHVFEATPTRPAVADYFPVPLRVKFDVRDGKVVSMTDPQATYARVERIRV